MNLTRRSLFASAVALLALPRRAAAERLLATPQAPVGTPERLFDLFMERAHLDSRPMMAMDFGHDEGTAAMVMWTARSGTVMIDCIPAGEFYVSE